MVLDEIQKRSIFKALATKGQFEVGMEFGIDKYHKSSNAIRAQVNKVYREVREEPEKYAISPEVLKMVEDGMAARRTTTIRVNEPVDVVKVSEKDLVVGAGRKAWLLLNRKLDVLAKDKKAFAEESLMNIAKMAGITFDKSQIVKGEATEHIALRAQIDQNITPEQALEQLLKFREANVTDGSE